MLHPNVPGKKEELHVYAHIYLLVKHVELAAGEGFCKLVHSLNATLGANHVF